MILKALYDLAQREELVPDPDFEIKPVSGSCHIQFHMAHYILKIDGTTKFSSVNI